MIDRLSSALAEAMGEPRDGERIVRAARLVGGDDAATLHQAAMLFIAASFATKARCQLESAWTLPLTLVRLTDDHGERDRHTTDDAFCSALPQTLGDAVTLEIAGRMGPPSQMADIRLCAFGWDSAGPRYCYLAAAGRDPAGNGVLTVTAEYGDFDKPACELLPTNPIHHFFIDGAVFDFLANVLMREADSEQVAMVH